MNTTSIVADPQQYVTDPGAPEFRSDIICDLWHEFRQRPEHDQVIHFGTELYRALLAYSGDDEEVFRNQTPEERGHWFAEHVVPGLILKTPTPEWAEETDNGFMSAVDATCVHSFDLTGSKSPLGIMVQRIDTYDYETATLTLGAVVAVIDVSLVNNKVTPAQLREMAAECSRAADRLEAIRGSEK